MSSLGCEQEKSGPAVQPSAPPIEFFDKPRLDPESVASLLSPGVYAVVARWVNEDSCEASGLVAKPGEQKFVALLRRGFSVDQPFLASIGCLDLENCRDLSTITSSAVARDRLGVAFHARVSEGVAFGSWENRDVRIVGEVCRRRVANGSNLPGGVRLVFREYSRAPTPTQSCEEWTRPDLEKAACRLEALDISFREPVTVVHSYGIDDCESWHVCSDVVEDK